MRQYVADTHALLWYLADDKRLSRAARRAFGEAENGHAHIVIPSVVLVEAVLLMQRQRVPEDTLRKVLALSDDPAANIYVVPLDVAVAREFASFGPVAIPELPDRIIAATARYLGAPLLTADPAIAETDLVQVVW